MMAIEQAEQLLDRWICDLAFREAARRSPELIVAAAGTALSHEERAAMRAVFVSLSAELSGERISPAA